jgi:hypothetical protein
MTLDDYITTDTSDQGEPRCGGCGRRGGECTCGVCQRCGEETDAGPSEEFLCVPCYRVVHEREMRRMGLR